MNVRLPGPEPIPPIDLAREAPFRLGDTEVRPPTLELLRDGHATTVEPKVMQVLTLLARRPGEVTSRDEMIQACWSGRFVGEDAIHRTIAKLRQAAEQAAGGDFTIETIPKVGYRLSPAKGPSRPPEAPRRVGADPAPARFGWLRQRRAVVAATGALLVVLAGAAAFRWANPLAPPSVARVHLARFTALGSGVPAGLTANLDEELRDAFGQDNAVVVTEGKGDYVLRGTVRREGDLLRYSVRLDDADDGAALWSTTRNRPVALTYAPATMAMVVSLTVRCGLSGAGEAGRRLPTHALALYLQHCDVAHWGHDAQRAMDIAQRLVAEAPGFSRGWSGLAMDAATAQQDAVTPADATAFAARGERAAARALALDPRNSEAYIAQAALKPGFQLVEKDALYRRAIAARPSDCGCEHESYGELLAAVGRIGEAVAQFKHAVDVQPVAPSSQTQLAEAYYMNHQSTPGAAILTRIDALSDGRWPAGVRYLDAVRNGRWAEAARALPADDPPERRLALGAAFAALAAGDRGRMAAAAPAVEQLVRQGGGEPVLTGVLTALGARPAALLSLESEVAQDTFLPPPSLFDPMIALLWDEPRYVRLLEDSGLIRYWRAARVKPDLCRTASAPSFCRQLD